MSSTCRIVVLQIFPIRANINQPDGLKSMVRVKFLEMLFDSSALTRKTRGPVVTLSGSGRQNMELSSILLSQVPSTYCFVMSKGLKMRDWLIWAHSEQQQWKHQVAGRLQEFKHALGAHVGFSGPIIVGCFLLFVVVIVVIVTVVCCWFVVMFTSLLLLLVTIYPCAIEDQWLLVSLIKVVKHDCSWQPTNKQPNNNKTITKQ